jgi:hypothetical protein
VELGIVDVLYLQQMASLKVCIIDSQIKALLFQRVQSTMCLKKELKEHNEQT